MDSRKITPFALGLAILFVVSIVEISAAADYPKVPILMVHGMGGSSSNWSTMISKLKANGYDAQLLYTIDITPNSTLCSESHVTEISNKVDEIVAESGFNRIDVMGHSRGGLNLYDYMRFSNGTSHVRNWISMGGVNNWPCSFNQDPPADPTPGDQTLYTSIYSTADTLVTPSMATIAGARNISVDGVNHLTMPSNAVIITHVLEALQGTGLNDGAGVSKSPSAPTGVRLLSTAN